MGQRLLGISTAALIEFFTAGEHPAYRIDKGAIPRDARILAILVHREQSSGELTWIELGIESATWPATQPGAAPEVLSPERQLLLPSEQATPIHVRRKPPRLSADEIAEELERGSLGLHSPAVG